MLELEAMPCVGGVNLGHSAVVSETPEIGGKVACPSLALFSMAEAKEPGQEYRRFEAQANRSATRHRHCRRRCRGQHSHRLDQGRVRRLCHLGGLSGAFGRGAGDHRGRQVNRLFGDDQGIHPTDDEADLYQVDTEIVDPPVRIASTLPATNLSCAAYTPAGGEAGSLIFELHGLLRRGQPDLKTGRSPIPC